MMEYDTRINKFYSRLYSKLELSFDRIKSTHVEYSEKVKNKFGYEIKNNVRSYNIQMYKLTEPIKWGFIGDESYSNNVNAQSFNETTQVFIADRKLMNKIVNESYENFDNYIMKEIAKLALTGHDKFFLPDDSNVSVSNMRMEVDESCISPKGNCVSHILLYPVISIAIEETDGF